MKKVLSFLAIAAMVCMVSCKKNTPNKPNNPQNEDPQQQEEPQNQEPEEEAATITIDGDFADWSKVEAVVGKNNPNSPWDAVEEIRVFANPDFVFYYIKYNKDSVKELLGDAEELPIRLCINTDGEFTSGYANYFLEAYDFIVEGALGNGEGGWADFDGTLHQRLDGWQALLEPGSNLVFGKGAGNEYEIMLAREIFNNAVPADQKMGDIFHTGIRFYGPAWDELSNIPNASVDDGDGNGWGHLLEVAVSK